MLDRLSKVARKASGEPIVAHLVGCGYGRIDPPILQPAAMFLDQSGEDIRGRLYLTTDPTGAELCLRPEWTLPVCREYLAGGQSGRVANYSTLGPVFRHQADGPAEINQAGLESFGRTDREAADADVLACALEAVERAGVGGLAVRIGDAGLFRAFLDALGLPPSWARRIAHSVAHGRPLDSVWGAEDGNGVDHVGVLAALEGADRDGARALVQDLLAIAGISAVGGRTATEIAERFLEQAALRGGPGVPDDKKALLTRFLAVEGDPDTASAALRAIADEARLDLGAALDGFDLRLNFLLARGVDLARTRFSAGFARRLDYYTGFVFEAHDPGRGGRPLIGGGRYDRLLRSLGAPADVPAVGAAIFPDRLAAGDAA